MSLLSISAATEVYRNASQCEIVRHRVDHPLLSDMSRSLQRFAQTLGEEADQEYWRRTLGPIRRVTFALCSVPMPFTQIASATGIEWARIQSQVRRCAQLFPDSHTQLVSLVDKLQQLSLENDSPLVAPLESMLQSAGSLCVLIRDPRMNRAAAEYFSHTPSLHRAKIVSPIQLRGTQVCDSLATIGPCGWFPEYIFSAPRAATIHAISFRWIRDGWKPGPIFLHNQGATNSTCNHRIGAMPRIVGDSHANIDAQSDLQPGDLLPSVPAFTRGTLIRPGSPQETVRARLCHVSGSRAVFLAADEGATSLIIDTSETGRTSIRRTLTDQLEPGHYLLLRTSGGGDYIAPLADRIMGALATVRRGQQVEWKERLLAVAIDRFGALERRDLACRVASEISSKQQSQTKPSNVHYWMSAKCISPRKYEDFLAVMTFANLSEEAPNLWSALQEINLAHRRAGFHIRRMLLQKIADTSLEPLERDGEMVFDLGEEDGGALSAFQVVAIDREDLDIPADQVGILLETEE